MSEADIPSGGRGFFVNNDLVLTLAGAWDTDSEEELRRQLLVTTTAQSGAKVMLDVSALSFIADAPFRTLASAASVLAAAGCSLVLVNPSPQLRYMAALADAPFTTFSSDEPADPPRDVYSSSSISAELATNLIQRFHAIGLELASATPLLASSEAAEHMNIVLEKVDDVIREIRSAVFARGLPTRALGCFDSGTPKD